MSRYGKGKGKGKGANVPLSSRERDFISHYLRTNNIVESARLSGYKCPETSGYRLMKKGSIVAELNRTLVRLEKKMELTIDDINRELHAAVTRTVDDMLDERGRVPTDLRTLSDKGKRVVDGIEQTVFTDSEGNEVVKTKLKLMSKSTALELAMKAKGMFAPKRLEGEIIHTLNWDNLKSPPVKDSADEIENLISNPRLLSEGEIIEGEIVPPSQ